MRLQPSYFFQNYILTIWRTCHLEKKDVFYILTLLMDMWCLLSELYDTEEFLTLAGNTLH